MKRLKILNEYKTPDDWKMRAKRIPEGGKGVAEVKRVSVFKIVIAAALTLVIGTEGFFLLRGSNNDMIEPVEPAPTKSSADSRLDGLMLRRALSGYYPDAYKDDLDALCEQVQTNYCSTFLTRQSGKVTTASDSLEGACREADAGYLSSMSLECDGYIPRTRRTTVLVKMLSLDDETDAAALASDYRVCAAAKNNFTGNTAEAQLKINYNDSFNTLYLRIDVSLYEEGEAVSDINDYNIDLHFYRVSDSDGDITEPMSADKAGERNDYHYTARVSPTGHTAVSSEHDGYDTVVKYLYDYFKDEKDFVPSGALELAEAYSYSDAEIMLTKSAETGKISADDIDREALNSPEHAFERSYARTVNIKYDGMTANSGGAYIFLKAQGNALSFVDNLANNMYALVYVYDTGAELKITEPPITVRDPDSGCCRITLRLPSDSLPEGEDIGIQIISDAPDYGEESLHYILHIPGRAVNCQKLTINN